MSTSESWRFLTPEAAGALRRTPINRWHYFALVFDHEGENATTRLVLRSALVRQLKSDDLAELAAEIERQRVPRGGVLALRLADDHEPRITVLVPASART